MTDQPTSSHSSKLFFRPSKPIIVTKPSEPSENENSLKDINDDSAWNWVDSDQKHEITTVKPAMDSSVKRKQPDTGSSPAPSPLEASSVKPPNKRSNIELDQPQSQTTSSGTGSLAEKRTFGSGLTTGSSFSKLIIKSDSQSIFGTSSGDKEDSLEESSSSAKPFLSASMPSSVPAGTSVEITTGEENEVVVFRGRVQLKLYDSENNEWKNRGAGPIHINLKENDGEIKGRIIVRNSGTLGLLLNCPIFKEMSIKSNGQKTLILGTIEKGKIESYALKFDSKQSADEAFNSLESSKDNEKASILLKNCKKNTTNTEPSSASKFVPSEANSPQSEYLDDEEGEFDEYAPP